jgi:hypothetical protein
VARPPNGGRAHRRGAQDGASGMFPLLVLGHSSADELGRSLAAAQKRERRERVSARVSARALVRFCSAGFRAWPLDEDGRLTTSGPGDAAQVGKRFPGPSPQRGLARGAHCARAGRRAIFSFGSVSSCEQ